MRGNSRLASLAFANPGINPPSQALRCPSVPEGPYLGPTMVLGGYHICVNWWSPVVVGSQLLHSSPPSSPMKKEEKAVH